MAEREIRANDKIHRIKCNEYGDVILIDETDRGIFDRLQNLSDNLDKVQRDAQKELDDIREKHADDADSTEAIVEAARADVRYIGRLIEELEAVFGKDCIKKVFRDNYELHSDYIPDELAIMDFLEQIIPITEEIYGARIKRVQKKYSVAYHGKGKRKRA